MMNLLLRRLSFAVASLAAALLLVALPHCVSDASGVTVLDSGPTVLDGGNADADAEFQVSGTVAGLPAAQTLTLLLNGGSALTVGDGPFSFTQRLAPAQGYDVTINASPSGYACGVANGSGTVAGDVTNVTVTCASTDTTLSTLSISAAPLSPAFSPTTFAYTTSLRAHAIFPPFETTTVTATATVPGAKITVAGTAVASATPSAPITIKGGANAIDIAVTAPDGMTTSHYSVTLTAIPNDYLKASNTRQDARFGVAVAISADGNTLAIGAVGDSSNAKGVNGNQADTSLTFAGAVYVFTRSNGSWTQQAYVKPSNTQANGSFGTAVSLSADGNTLAVGSPGEASNATGVGGPDTDTSMAFSGAAYVFTRTAGNWAQTTYIKASNTAAQASFGAAIALSGDGLTLAVGSYYESSNGSGVGGSQTTMTATSSGAVYVFAYAAAWTQQVYIKASNPLAGTWFGSSVALSANGNTLAVGSELESGGANTINGNQNDTSAPGSGAAYVLTRSGTTWTQEAYVKPSNTHSSENFGVGVALSSDGKTLAVGAFSEASKGKGVNDLADQNDTSVAAAGAAFTFTRSGTTWSQEAYLKPSNTKVVPSGGINFGRDIAISGDGNSLVVGAYIEPSNATGVNGDQTNSLDMGAGAAYAFSRAGTTWSQVAYIKASNTRVNVDFGQAVRISSDGTTIVIGGPYEPSSVTGVNGNQSNASAPNAGAAYVF